MSDEEADARVEALRAKTRRILAQKQNATPNYSSSASVSFTPSPVLSTNNAGFIAPSYDSFNNSMNSRASSYSIIPKNNESSQDACCSSSSNGTSFEKIPSRKVDIDIDFNIDNMPKLKIEDDAAEDEEDDDEDEEPMGENSFKLNKLFKNAEKVKNVKMLRDAFFSKPKKCEPEIKLKLGDDEPEFEVVENHDDEPEVDYNTLPAFARPLYASAEDGEAAAAASKSTDRHKPRKHVSDRIRLANNYHIRPEDAINQGPNVSYDEVVTIQGGGGKKYPNVKRTLYNLDLCPEILQNLESLEIRRLRKIQEHIIPLILENTQEAVFSAPTGNGKTLGYLIAVIQICATKKRDKAQVQRKPKAAILLQNHETAEQVYKMAQKISEGLELSIIPVIGSNNMNTEIGRLRTEGGDMVIGTTGRFIQYITESKIPLDHLELLIFDEADQFVKDKGWETGIKILRQRMPPNRRMLLFSATYDDEARLSYLQFLKNDHWFVALGELNQVEKLIRQNFVLEERVNHAKSLIKLLIEKSQNNTCPKTLVFCNTMDRADFIAARLRMFRDIPSPFEVRASALHSSLPATDRNLIFKHFELPHDDEYALDVIVASDKISCGVSTPAELVVNYDIPVELSTYILRVGRTGRNGHRGEAFTFVGTEALRCLNKDDRRNLFNMLTAAKASEVAPLPKELDDFYDKNNEKFCRD